MYSKPGQGDKILIFSHILIVGRRNRPALLDQFKIFQSPQATDGQLEAMRKEIRRRLIEQMAREEHERLQMSTEAMSVSPESVKKNPERQRRSETTPQSNDPLFKLDIRDDDGNIVERIVHAVKFVPLKTVCTLVLCEIRGFLSQNSTFTDCCFEKFAVILQRGALSSLKILSKDRPDVYFLQNGSISEASFCILKFEIILQIKESITLK